MLQCCTISHAPTDGDSWAYFADANVLATDDTFSSRNYPNLDWGSDGTIEGMIAATERCLKTVNNATKIVPGHGPLSPGRRATGSRNCSTRERASRTCLPQIRSPISITNGPRRGVLRRTRSAMNSL